jgi:serpin B
MLNKLLIILFMIPLALIVSSCNLCEADVEENEPLRELDTAEKMVVEAENSFGLKLFKNLNLDEPDKNLFISPLSVSLAFGMSLNGADGDTYEAIKNTLEFFGLTETEINESYRGLIDLLVNLDEEVIFNIANSIWYRDSFSVEQLFLDTNTDYFDAKVQGLDFSDPASKDIINSWVDDITEGLIIKILENDIPAQTVMYLINAIYFKGIWASEFDKSNTNDEPFYNYDNTVSSVPLMFQNKDFLYAETDQFQAVDLMYGDSLFSMTILLPKDGNDVNDIVAMLDENTLSNQFYSTEVDLHLPKFELEWKKELNDVLKAMGMDIAFAEGLADFTRINKEGNLFIDEVLHKTFIKVDEEGTEAAAVTSIGISLTSLPQTVTFRIDQPFIFMIREHHSNTILFIGKVLEL